MIFFLMEETNYKRGDPCAHSSEDTQEPDNSVTTSNGLEKGKRAESLSPPELQDLGEVYQKKSYVQKLSFSSPKGGYRKVLKTVQRSLFFLTWPIIFYAG